MKKYLQFIESINNDTEYKIGDYVIVTYGKNGGNLKMLFKIIEIIDKPELYDDIIYKVAYYNLNYDEFKTNIYKNQIIRFATQDEIDKLEINLNMKKYNL